MGRQAQNRIVKAISFQMDEQDYQLCFRAMGHAKLSITEFFRLAGVAYAHQLLAEYDYEPPTRPNKVNLAVGDITAQVPIDEATEAVAESPAKDTPIRDILAIARGDRTQK